MKKRSNFDQAIDQIKNYAIFEGFDIKLKEEVRKRGCARVKNITLKQQNTELLIKLYEQPDKQVTHQIFHSVYGEYKSIDNPSGDIKELMDFINKLLYSPSGLNQRLISGW